MTSSFTMFKVSYRIASAKTTVTSITVDRISRKHKDESMWSCHETVRIDKTVLPIPGYNILAIWKQPIQHVKILSVIKYVT